LVALVVIAAGTGDPWRIVSFSVFGATLVVLYTISTLYHSTRGRAKAVFQKLDHCAIYLLIAGTYTPFALVALRGALGWTLFGLAWGLALLGIAQEFRFGKGARWLSLAIYLVMGWMGIVAVSPLVATLGAAGVAWLVTGGALYTAGIVFYVYDERVRHFHGIWHLFVLGGSASHWATVALYMR
jgi:hemolysin III